MTRNLTLAGYAVLGLAMVAYQLIGIVGRRTATLGQALQPVVRSLAGRLLLLTAWVGRMAPVRAGRLGLTFVPCPPSADPPRD